MGVPRTFPNKIIHVTSRVYSAHILPFVLCHILSPLCDKQSVATTAIIKLLKNFRIGNKISSYLKCNLQDVKLWSWFRIRM